MRWNVGGDAMMRFEGAARSGPGGNSIHVLLMKLNTEELKRRIIHEWKGFFLLNHMPIHGTNKKIVDLMSPEDVQLAQVGDSNSGIMLALHDLISAP